MLSAYRKYRIPKLFCPITKAFMEYAKSSAVKHNVRHRPIVLAAGIDLISMVHITFQT